MISLERQAEVLFAVSSLSLHPRFGPIPPVHIPRAHSSSFFDQIADAHTLYERVHRPSLSDSGVSCEVRSAAVVCTAVAEVESGLSVALDRTTVVSQCTHRQDARSIHYSDCSRDLCELLDGGRRARHRSPDTAHAGLRLTAL